MLQKLIIETITANHAHCNCGGNALTFVALNYFIYYWSCIDLEMGPVLLQSVLVLIIQPKVFAFEKLEIVVSKNSDLWWIIVSVSNIRVMYCTASDWWYLNVGFSLGAGFFFCFPLVHSNFKSSTKQCRQVETLILSYQWVFILRWYSESSLL